MKITDFEIRNFRAFHSLALTGLQRVNLIAGENNVGKTAVLEALWQFSGPDQPDLGLRLDQFRGLDPIDPDALLADLFYRYDTSEAIQLSARGDWGSGRRSLRISTQQRETSSTALRSNNGRGNLPREIVLRYADETSTYESKGWFVTKEAGPGIFQNSFEKKVKTVVGRPVSHLFSPRHRSLPQEDAERYGRMEVEGREQSIVEALQFFEPLLRRLTTISVNGVPVIHADVGLGRLMPMGLLGDGIQRVLSLALAFGYGSGGGMVLIDEIENGIHHSRLADLWRAVSTFSEQFDVQVFATTHSHECVRAAHQVFAELDDYEFRFLRLDRVNGRIKGKAFDKTTLGTALDAGLEIR